MDKTDIRSEIESISNPLETRDLEVSAILVVTEHSGETVPCFGVLKKPWTGASKDPAPPHCLSRASTVKHSGWKEEAQRDRALNSKQTQTSS